jgi:hypothetical protein
MCFAHTKVGSPSGTQFSKALAATFAEFPNELILDKDVPTTLGGEYLPNEDGLLEIHKLYDSSSTRPASTIVAVAYHPTAAGVSDLLLLKQPELKARLKDLGVDTSKVGLRKNPEMRRALWANRDLTLKTVEIPLNSTTRHAALI